MASPEKSSKSASSASKPKRAPKQSTASRARRGRTKKSDPAVEQVSADDEPAPKIDEVLSGLERVVRELESGELPLESALAQFERGVRLARQGSALLDAVEQRVEVLLADRDAVAPFASGEGEDHG